MNIKQYTDYIDNTKKWRLDQLKDSNDPWDIGESWNKSTIHYGYDPTLLDKNFELLKLYKEEKMKYNNNEEKEKEKDTNMFDTSNMMNKYFGKVANGMVRMSMNGDMAIKTSNGYKTYDVKTGALTNCDAFVFDVGSEFFFIIPTNKVETGDVILAAGKPHCVIKAEANRIEALRYEDGSIVNIVPERNVMFGRTYFYGKIVSMFGKITGNNGDKGMKNMMKYFIMSEMMGKNGNGNNNSMLPLMMFMGNNSMEDMFEGMFDFDEDEKEEK